LGKSLNETKTEYSLNTEYCIEIVDWV
jgi:hypothetical protein